MGKVLVTVHLGRHFSIFGHYDYEVLKDLGHEVHIAANFNEKIDNFEDLGVIKHDIDFNRNPISFDNFKALKQLKKILSDNNFDIIHTQSPSGGAVTRIAAIKSRKKGTKIIYTAHGFHFYKGAPLKNWILFYPIERWLARYTDVLITINKEDYIRAKKLFKDKKVEYIPGVGIDTKKFNKVVVNKLAKRKELGLPEDAFVVLSVGEINRNKNHEIIIKAIAKLNNPNIYYVICGQGVLADYLIDLAKQLSLEKKVKFLGYRRDVVEIIKISNIFAFPSFREGLSIALMEAMSAGLPVVCSKIRGNTDLIEEEKGGYLVEPNDVEGFANSINKIIKNETLKNNMGKYNEEFIKKFDISNVKRDMEKIYSNLINNI